MNEKEISKLIALVLRHKPEVIGINLDEHGWAQVDALISGISSRIPFDAAILEKIVAEDEKQRYAFNEDHTLIRANQGHSIPVDVELTEKIPPKQLWHGTGEKYAASIRHQGLISKSRLYVHLSSDYNTAVKVGSRHGKAVVFEVDCQAMVQDGYVFYQSLNGVWLTKAIPPKYLSELVEFPTEAKRNE